MSDSITLINARLWPRPHDPVSPNGYLVCENGIITDLGVGEPETTAGRVVDAGDRVLMPGLIQTHVHLCQTIFRGIGEDLPLLPWLRGFIWPMEAAHTPASIRASAQLAAAEMIRSGTTAFMSMETVRHTEHAVQAIDEIGLYGLLCHCLMDETGGCPELAMPVEQGLQTCRDLKAAVNGHARLRIGVAPRFVLSCSEDNLKAACAFAREEKLMLHTHASEQVEEVNLVRERTGLDNVEYLHEVGLTGPDVGLAHCVHTNPRERELLCETDTRILHCPSANLKLGSGVAPIPEYLAAGLTVSIGADGTPCNNRLDALTEMREAGLMQKPRLGPDALSAADIVAMATEHGARALGWENRMGRLAKGLAANFILLDLNSVHSLPCEDPATVAVYSAEASDVHMTVVDGKILYEAGAFTTLDIDQLRADVREQRRGLEERAGLRAG